MDESDVPIQDKDTVIFFDTTLRDGEQSPGATLNVDEKLEIARQLSRLGVDVCEAGFPIASPGDFDAVRRIAEEVGPLLDGRKSNQPMIIAGLARASKTDIQRAYDAVKVAPRHRIHTFLATSDIHLKHKLKIDREECIEQVIEAVTFASSLCSDIEFSPEDAGRSDPDFLVQVLGEAIKAGATTLNIPDTVGYTTPDEFGWLIKYLIANTPGADKVVWSVHCHDDLGLATANTLAGVQNGARQVEVTINGIGERAGNTSLEEVAMAIVTRPQTFNVQTHIDTTQITRTSRMVSAYTGMVVQPNKAIVGANAFAHEAGIHQDGMLKNQQTYEIMRPETVGLHASKLVLGKHSGRHAFRVRLEDMGYGDLDKEELNAAFQRFKRLADKKKVVTDADIEAIIADEIYQPPEIWKLNHIQVSCGDNSMPTASVSLTGPDGVEYRDAALGTGPVDAVYQAVNRIVGVSNRLTEFTINAVTEGLDAVAETTIRIQPENGGSAYSLNPQTNQPFLRTFSGHGASTDIVVSSARAYISALNKMLAAREELSSEVSVMAN
ncbi:MAG: 2-isopropylmalate synthase [Chloroflexi bacterium]|nr:2-isopropylmalate synthase [Chloroflexota bacterium]MBK6712696.1 2-isopropylmalate synthase [Chloroflexota bacterium]MBK7177841.1 2-isopropylmalate synthase [Chloroflexota bacterium]MBK7916218.1 2-isopropylmalate synthase [Chloroflexota bacterium]MBP6806124.1 2-isopropylmalate synthase [Chloroflexota bacterium]